MTCRRALDSAGEVCPSCFRVHPPATRALLQRTRMPGSYAKDYPGGEIDIAEGLDHGTVNYIDLTIKTADPELEPGDIECTCSRTFADQGEFDRHLDEDTGYTGHWNVRNI